MNAVVVSAVGDDDDGWELKKKLEAYGVKSLMKMNKKYHTGKVLVILRRMVM